MKFVDRLVARDSRSNDSEEDQRAYKRAAMLPASELPIWVDNAISETGRQVQNYLRDRDDTSLQEARVGVKSLQILLEELHRRS